MAPSLFTHHLSSLLKTFPLHATILPFSSRNLDFLYRYADHVLRSEGHILTIIDSTDDFLQLPKKEINPSHIWDYGKRYATRLA